MAIFSALFSVREAGGLCSIGTLLAFVIVSMRDQSGLMRLN